MLFIKNKKTRKAIVHALYIFCFFTFINYLSSCVDGDGFLISSLSQPSDDEQTLAPDLAINDLTIREMPTNRQSIALSTTVNNIGTESTGGSIIGWYLSTNSVINTNDTLLKASVIFYLSPNGKHSKSTVSTIPPIAGTYYYGACVAPVSNEIVTSNNCSRGTPIIVSPDLIANSVSVSNTNIRVGEELTLSTSISNSETANANANIVTLSWYRSTDSDITSADTLIGSNIITGILIGGSENKRQSFIATSNSGVYYYGACVEHVIGGETNLDNNCSKAIFIEVINTDVAIGELIVSDETPSNNQSITLSTTVSNVGRLSSSASTLRWYRSTDSNITSADTLIGSNIIPILSAKNSENINLFVNVPSDPRVYYYGACVDAVVGETNLGDNCSSTSIEVIAPDLIVIQIASSDMSPTNRQSVTLSVTISNIGTTNTSATTLRWYRSANLNMTASDIELGTNFIDNLDPGDGESKNLLVTVPFAGTYYYRACADAAINESYTNNNCSTVLEVSTAFQKLFADDSGINDYFGASVAIDGNYAIIGAYKNDNNRGSAYIFQKQVDDTWLQNVKLTASDGSDNDYFGGWVAIDDDYLISGAPTDSTGTSTHGSAYIFKRQPDDSWQQQQKLTASDASHADFFGVRVAIDGDTVVIGATGDDDSGTDSGAVYIFSRSGLTWSERQKLTAPDGVGNEEFGVSTAIDGDHVLVGASRDNNLGSKSGSVYYFTETSPPGSWTNHQLITAPDGGSNHEFGYSVAINGNTAIIGAPGDDDGAGSAYIFQRSGLNWSYTTKLIASDSSSNDSFGYSVSISGDYVIVGAYLNDNDDKTDSGSAYIFRRQTDSNWVEVNKILDPNGAPNDFFGTSVSISGNVIIIGSIGDDDNKYDAGSVFIHY